MNNTVLKLIYYTKIELIKTGWSSILVSTAGFEDGAKNPLRAHR